MRSKMSERNFPKNTFVVVATGAEAKLFENQSESGDLKLKSIGSVTPSNLNDSGPAGVRPPESSQRETDEATFSKQLTEKLYKWAQAGKFHHIVLVADPNTLGEIRPLLHQEVTDKMVLELDKTLINSPIEDIEKILTNEL